MNGTIKLAFKTNKDGSCQCKTDVKLDGVEQEHVGFAIDQVLNALRITDELDRAAILMYMALGKIAARREAMRFAEETQGEPVSAVKS